jgi:hypothetical protein
VKRLDSRDPHAAFPSADGTRVGSVLHRAAASGSYRLNGEVGYAAAGSWARKLHRDLREEDLTMDGLRVSPREAKDAHDGGKAVVFLDVRSPGAWGESADQLPSSVRLPLTDFEAHADELPRESELVAYCT